MSKSNYDKNERKNVSAHQNNSIHITHMTQTHIMMISNNFRKKMKHLFLNIPKILLSMNASLLKS